MEVYHAEEQLLCLSEFILASFGLLMKFVYEKKNTEYPQPYPLIIFGNSGRGSLPKLTSLSFHHF